METLLQVGLSNTLLATALAVLAALVGAVTRRPALAHGLWLLVLFKLVTPPFVHLPILPMAPAAVPEESAAAALPLTPEELQRIVNDSQYVNAPAVEVPLPASLEMPVEPAMTEDWTPNWQTALVALWFAGSAGWFLLAGYRVWRFRFLLRHARPVPPELHAEIVQLAQRLGLRHCPEVRFVPGPVSPMLWSLGGPPLLLLPMELWERLTEEQRQTLAVHELAHLARRDHWVRGLELLATGLYWWNPVVWWARHGLREAEERCCDAWVVWALPAAARAYAAALVETVDFLSEARPVLPAAASGIGHVRMLKRRLTMILQGRTPRALSATGFLMLAALAALLLPLLPTWAQEPEPRKVRIGVQVQGADEDEAIAELKKRLAELEAKRAREKAKPAGEDKNKAAEIDKARAEVKKLAMAVQQKRAEAMAVEAELHKAMHRLAHLEGPGNVLFLSTGGGPRIEQGQILIRREGKVTAFPPPPHLPGEVKKMQIYKRMEGNPPGSEERLNRLERQLGELIREVKELRKERKK